MIFLVKTNNWLKLFSSSSEDQFIDSIGRYNPVFEILYSYEGPQKVISKIKSEMHFTDSWIECTPERVEKLIQLIQDYSNTAISELIQKINRRYDFITKKIKRKIVDWIETNYNWQYWQEAYNLSTSLPENLDLIKNTNPDIYKKAIDLKQYLFNFQKIMDAKRYCKNVDPIQVLPNTIIEVKTYIDESKTILTQHIKINDKEVIHIRSIDSLDFKF